MEHVILKFYVGILEVWNQKKNLQKHFKTQKTRLKRADADSVSQLISGLNPPPSQQSQPTSLVPRNYQSTCQARNPTLGAPVATFRSNNECQQATIRCQHP